MCWTLVKSRHQQSSVVASLRDKNGLVCDEAMNKAEILTSQFSLVCISEDTTDMSELSTRLFPEIPDIIVGMELGSLQAFKGALTA